MTLPGLFGTAIGQDAQGEGGGEGGDPSRLPVKDKDLTAPPGSPSIGDRYIVASVATGVWTGHEDDIAEWAGASWVFETPIIGWITYVDDEMEYYSWNGTAWVQESAGPHASTHEDGGTDEVQVENLPTAGALGEVPTSDGAGGLTMIEPGEKPLNGFPNRTDSTIGMNGSNFEIAPAVSTFDFWSDGTKYTKSGTDAVAISNDKTLHFVYYDTSGVLQVSTTIWDILAGLSLVATVFKDGANYVVTEERHGWRRSRDWHNWAHRTIGARYDSGLTGTFLDAAFSVVQGVVADEDIFYDTGASKTDCQLWYRDVGLATMRVELGVVTPYKAAVGVIQYDNAGVLTNVSNNRFVNSYVYATNVPAYPIVVVVGQAEYVTLAGAQEEAFPSILLSTAEWKLLYRTTYKNVGGTPTHQADTDFRLVSTGPAQSPISNSHAGLIDRDLANAHPALAVAPDVSGFAAILSAADDTVQKALDTLDSHAAEHKDGGTDELDVEELASAGSAGALATSNGAGAVAMVPHDPVKWYDAASLDSPDGTADVPGSMAAAPIVADSVASNIPVRFMDDAAETGVLLQSTVHIPTGATNMKLHSRSHPETAPGSAKNAVLVVYARKHNSGAARGSWGSGVTGLVPITTNVFDVFGTIAKTLAAWGLTAGAEYQILISRDPADVSDDLVDALELRQIGLEFY